MKDSAAARCLLCCCGRVPTVALLTWLYLFIWLLYYRAW